MAADFNTDIGKEYLERRMQQYRDQGIPEDDIIQLRKAYESGGVERAKARGWTTSFWADVALKGTWLYPNGK